MKKVFTIVLLFMAAFANHAAFSQSNVLDPNDPDVVFTSTNQPPVPAYAQLSKWGHTSRLAWNPFSYGYKSYYYKGMAFRIKFPKSYQHNVADGKIYPSIIFMHGLGEPGNVWDNEYHLVHGGQTHAEKINNGTFDGFMIYPQSQSGYLQNYFPILKELVDSLVKYVKVDIDRVHIGGLSSGGQATWDFPQQQQYAKIACALEPISAAQNEDVNSFASHISIPVFVANGGQDKAPYPSTVTTIINSYKNLGGYILQAFFPEQGHGAWNSFWADPRYWPFINAQHKANPVVLFQHDKFCPNETVNATLILQAGFAAYEWDKDGAIIAGQNTNQLSVTAYGTYRGRFKRTASGAWSAWSPTPAVISQNQGTVSPAIQVSGLRSNVLPAPDGSTVVPLIVPNSYSSYEWRKVSDNSLVSSANTYDAPVGQFKVKVTEQFGCGSDFSTIFTVIDANGTNAPAPASSLAAVAISNNQVQLDWNDNPNAVYNETAFEIYRSLTPGNSYTLIGKTGQDTLSFLDQGLSANTKYYYIIRAINENGAAANSTEANATTQSDIVAPAAPANLIVTGSTRSSVSLSWDASTDDVGVTKYEVYVNGARSYVTTNTTFTVNNLTALETYSFYVKALDASGNLSPASSQVNAAAALRGLSYKYYEGSWDVLPDFNALTPVATGLLPNVSITPRIQSDAFGFLWEGYINIPVTGSYTFETFSDDGSKLYIGKYSHTATALVNNDGLHGAQYAAGTVTLTAGLQPISITFFEKSGGESMGIFWTSTAAGIPTRTAIPNSAFTDVVTIPASSLPAKPSNFGVVANAYNKVNLAWTDNSNNESGFEISRSTEPGGTYVNIGTTPANATSFIDSTGLAAQTIYWYKIKAVNQYGQSEAVSVQESMWGFNNNYNDESGNNRNLTGTATPAYNAADKKEGSHSISLNGSTQYINLPFSTSGIFPADTYSTRTVGVWLKPTALSIISSNKIIYDFGGADNGMSLRFNAGSLQAGIASANNRFTVIATGITANPKWISNGWNHVSVVYDVNKISLYLNAVLLGTTNLNFNSVSSSTNASRIGATNGVNAFNSGTSSTNYGGLIDGMVVIKESLNAAGIAALMNQSYTADTTLNLPAMPVAPSNLISTSKTTTTVSLSFADNSTNESAFELYRSAVNVNSYRLLATITGGEGSTKSYTDSNLFSNTTYYYKVRAKGIGGTTSFTPDLMVKTANNRPLFVPVSNFTMRYNSQKSVAISATDTDAETVVISFVSPLPAFVAFIPSGSGAGSLQLNPSVSDQGSYVIKAVATDSNQGTDTLTLTVVVNDNYTPVIAVLNNVTIAEKASGNMSLTATDQNGNGTLAWTLTAAPSFVTLTDNGNGAANLAYAPGFSHAGVYNITASVNDGSGGVESASFALTVTNVDPPVEKWLISTKYNSANAPAPWNNVSTINTNSLINTSGVATGVGIQFLNTVWNAGNAGAVTGNNSGVYPDAVIKDYFWCGAYAAPATVNFNLKGLTAGAKYNVTLFGSSAWTALGNNGTTVYTINGVAKSLYVDKNQQNTVTFSAITPDAAGNITVNMSKGVNAPYAIVNAIILEKPFDDGTVPALPTNLTAQGLPDGTIRLAWKDVAYNESRYLVHRATTEAGPYTLINPSAANANDTTYIDNTVAGGTTYFYKIEAANTAGTSGYSNTATITVSNKVPVLIAIADQYVKSDNAANLAINASDDLGDILTTTVKGLPAFATYQNTGNGTGNITFNPSSNDLGVYPGISVTVTDNAGAAITRVFSLTVTENSVRSAYLNFGPAGATTQASPWNNFLLYPFANSTYSNIKDDANVVTGFGFKFLSQWSGGLSNGMRTGNNSGVFPDNVMKTSFHNSNNGNHVIEFNGLNPAKRYSIGFLTNSHTGVASPVTFTSGTQTITVDGKYNTTVLANLNGLVPNASGIIQVTIVKVAANPVLSLNGVVIREYNAADPVIRPADLFTETILQTDKIKLTWSDRSSDETGFQIWRSTAANGTYALVTTAAANTTTYTDEGLAPNKRYYYKVRAVKGADVSNYSNISNSMLASGIVLLNLNVNAAQQAPSPWNSTNGPSTQGAAFSNLINTALVNSGFEMVITKEFNGAGFAGVNANGVFPANVMFTNYWTDAGQTSQVKFQNLDISKKYRIGCFGSNTTVNNTVANYTSNGKTVELNSYYNSTKVVYLDKLTPGENGELIVSVNTATGSPYNFTGAFTIEYFTDDTPDGPVVNTINTTGAGIAARNSNLIAKSPVIANKVEIAAATPPVIETVVDNIKVFPNPFTNNIKVELQNLKASSVVTIMMFDMSGKLVFKSAGINAMKGNNTVGSDLPVGLSLTPGMYSVNVWIDGKLSKAAKLIKVK